MQEYTFLPKIGEDPKAFWTEANTTARAHGADPLITYMHLMYKKAKARGIRIDREDLVALGRAVELFPGVDEWFGEIADYIAIRAESQGVTLRHYLISSGLVEIIEGTRIFPHFHNVFASEYWFEAYDVPYPKRVITDTGKTQYLFRINKGIENLGDSINEHMPEAARPIPFANMIYFGDGDTDVPIDGRDAQERRPRHRRPSARQGARPSASTCSRPAAAISSRPPTTAEAPSCSSAPPC